MTEQEFADLEIGDIVYYYYPVSLSRIGSLNASVIKKAVNQIVYTTEGEKRVGLEKGGVILNSLLFLFETEKDKILANKLKRIKMLINTNKSRKVNIADMKKRYSALLLQKNVRPLLATFPELFI